MIEGRETIFYRVECRLKRWQVLNCEDNFSDQICIEYTYYLDARHSHVVS